MKATNQTKAYLALVFVCIVWGTTYLAIRVGVQNFPAFLFAGIRQAIAGIILVIAALIVNKKGDWSARNLLMQALIGALLITLGNGLVTWGEVRVDSGVTALVCSVMPIFAVLFNLAISKKEHFNVSIAAGLLLGFGGVAIIFKDSIAQLANSAYVLSIIGLLVATSSWAVGSILSKKQPKPVNPILNSGLQLFFGGAFMLIVSPAVDDYSNIHMNTSALISLLYLIVFGSVLAYAAYIYVLSKLPIGISTLYAYFNPLIAVVLGYFALNEPLNANILLAFIAIMSGVYLVNRGYRRAQKQSETIPVEKLKVNI